MLAQLQRMARRLAGVATIDDAHSQARKPHARTFETVEPRRMLSADPVFSPIQVGTVYTEDDSGSDHAADTLEFDFSGGGEGTELTRIIISGDKDFDLAGFLAAEADLSTPPPTPSPIEDLDVFFDTEESAQTPTNNGWGADLAHPFRFDAARSVGISESDVTATVVDGTSLLILEIADFTKDDKLVITIDVDQAIDLDFDSDPSTPEIEGQNDGVDPLASGVEFQGSTFHVEFDSPHFADASGSSIYVDFYDNQLTGKSLDLPTNDQFNNRDRTAGTMFEVEQEPLPVTISGTVFHDRDQSLTQERDADPNLDEHGISGVTLELFEQTGTDTNGDPIFTSTGFTTTTNSDGFYEFGADLKLCPGTYEVREGDVPDYFDVGAVPGTVNGNTSGETDGPNVLTRITIGLGGQQSIDNDFAEARPAEIHGNVHLSTRDGDCFGDQVVHPPLSGVRVELWQQTGVDGSNNPVYTFTGEFALTDDSGDYWFTDLMPGTYAVREFTPVDSRNIQDGGEQVGDAGGSVTGNDDPDGYDEISGITLASGQVAVDYDFCEHLPIEISGYVYHDVNDDGNFDDTSEAPIGNVAIQLVRRVDNGTSVVETVIDSTTTNSAGYYQFTDVPFTVSEAGIARTLFVREIQPGPSAQAPDGWIDGKDTTGTGMLNNGDNLTNDQLKQIEAGYGDVGVNFNFGELLPVSIAGNVYHDRANDGDRDPGDEGLGGSTIQIIRTDLPTPQVVRTLVTLPDGSYEARGLAPGKYIVRQITQPTRINPLTGLSEPYRDGIDNGGYVDLDPGPGENRDYRGTATNPGDEIGVIMLMQGEDSIENNFGEYLPASISGRVFLSDQDHNCELPNGILLPERALEGVTIQLFSGDPSNPANFVDSTTTDAFGRYEFLGLDPGEYTIVEITPGNLLDGDEHVGTHGGIVLNADSPNSTITDIHLASGDDGMMYDFCEHKPAKISGFVYHDRNNNGVKETGEEGLTDVLVTLYDENGNVVDTTFTDNTGMYMFGDLKAGRYKIQEGDPGAQWLDGKDAIGTIDTFDKDGNLLGTRTDEGEGMELDMLLNIDLVAGDMGVNYNFGEYLPSTLEGYVFTHPGGDEDCELEFHETPADPIAGVTVELVEVSTGNVIDNMVTDNDGKYRFEDIPPGEYTVREIHPNSHFQGDQNAGYVTSFDDATIRDGGGDDSSADLIVGINISSGSDRVQYNFCEVPPSSISGTVFQDGEALLSTDGNLPPDVATLRDGVLTPDDTRIPGVVLELRHTFGGNPVDASEALPGIYPAGPIRTVTGADGTYQFTGLAAGNYTVVEIHPSAYFDYIDTAGTRPGVSTNGVAINSVSDITPAIFGSWSTTPPLDTIAFIGLPAGTDSPEHNFAELLIRDEPGTPEDPPVIPPPVVVPPPFIPPSELPPQSVVTPPPPTNPIYYSGPISSYTWHLSVVNGGLPRQLSETGNSPVRFASNANLNAFAGHTADEATWRLQGEEQLRIFGIEDGRPLSGDFNGDGVDELAVYHEGHWFIDLNGNGMWDEDDLYAKLGDHEDLPVTGDWDGDGKDDIGIFGPAWPRDPHAIERDPGLPDPLNDRDDLVHRPKNLPPLEEDAALGSRVLKRTADGTPREDLIDHVFLYGVPGDAPIAGDWNGDGIVNIGVFRNGQWLLDADGDGRLTAKDDIVQFGSSGDIPVVGDFNGDGIDNLGVYRNGTWILDIDGNRELDAADKVFELGGPLDHPVTGDWDADGVDEAAIYRPGVHPELGRRAG